LGAANPAEAPEIQAMEIGAMNGGFSALRLSPGITSMGAKLPFGPFEDADVP